MKNNNRKTADVIYMYVNVCKQKHMSYENTVYSIVISIFDFPLEQGWVETDALMTYYYLGTF